jgi:hypothetical protein
MWNSDAKLQLKNLTLEELQEWCSSIGERRGGGDARAPPPCPLRAQQRCATHAQTQRAGQDPRRGLPLWKAMYQDGRWLSSLQQQQQDTPQAAAAADGSSGATTAPAATIAAAEAAGVFKPLDELQLHSALKAAVQDRASLDGGLTLQSVTTARDGTHK